MNTGSIFVVNLAEWLWLNGLKLSSWRSTALHNLAPTLINHKTSKQVSWIWLKINSTGQRPSRSGFWDHYFDRTIKMYWYLLGFLKKIVIKAILSGFILMCSHHNKQKKDLNVFFRCWDIFDPRCPNKHIRQESYSKTKIELGHSLWKNAWQ